MKKLVVSLAMATVVAVIFVSCALFSDDSSNPAGLSTSSGSSGTTIYGKEFWGEWVRMDANEMWYIASDYIKIGNSKTSRKLSLAKQSEKIIKVTEGGKEYYLYANRIANATISGKVASFDGTSRSASSRSVAGGKGWIQVVIDNLSNGGNSTTVTTDGTGHFTVPGVIPGDGYTVTPQGGAPVTVTPSGDGDDVGTVTMTQGVNFKTRIIAQNDEYSYTNIDHLFATSANSLRPYEFKLSIKNEGNTQCTAATCEITWDSDLHITFSDADYRLLKTIEPGKTKEIKLRIWCDEIATEAEYKKINIKITDQETKKVYEDSVSLRFFKSNLNLNFASQSTISAFVIAPTGKLYYVRNTREDNLVLPYLKGDYYVVFSGATADTETRYTLGVNSYVDTAFTGFFDLLNYEPNNTQTTTTQLSGKQTIMSYLHKNDIDFYRITLSGDVPAPRPVTVVHSSTYSSSISYSHNPLKQGHNGDLYFKLLNNFRNTYGYDAYSPYTGIMVTISSSSRYVTFLSDSSTASISSSYDSYRFGNRYYDYINNIGFKVKISEDCPVGKKLPFTLTFTDKNGNTWSDEIVVPVE